METLKGDIWDFWDFRERGDFIVITTNGDVNKHGKAVMGRGVACQAAEKFSFLQKELADRLVRKGNHVYVFLHYRLITFPVKHHWHEKADLELIERSARELKKAVETTHSEKFSKKFNRPPINTVYMVKPGVGNGRLKWELVEPILDLVLDERFIIVDRE